MSDTQNEKVERAADRLLDAVEDLAEFGWDADRIREELQAALEVAHDDGLLESAD